MPSTGRRIMAHPILQKMVRITPSERCMAEVDETL